MTQGTPGRRKQPEGGDGRETQACTWQWRSQQREAHGGRGSLREEAHAAGRGARRQLTANGRAFAWAGGLRALRGCRRGVRSREDAAARRRCTTPGADSTALWRISASYAACTLRNSTASPPGLSGCASNARRL
eukprot:CAMPEP_0117555484 /NCGR_PEP_ID=MMETSP0784-20121206/51298_1 /TAXON_ID=39447 /ORGANISM="" /LENGTH=133 /DNA_ID=CAMNT_0005352691 /DNA_START=24 /DNA_END=426 /DNA_ORIENTATION=-